MDVLERMLSELDTHKSLQSDAVTSDVSDENVLENTSRLRRAARKVITSASSVVSSGSTVWGGSIAGDEPMPSIIGHKSLPGTWHFVRKRMRNLIMGESMHRGIISHPS